MSSTVQSLSDGGPKEKVMTYLDPEDLEWIEDQVGDIFEGKSEVIRYAVKAMRKRGALKTLEELQED